MGSSGDLARSCTPLAHVKHALSALNGEDLDEPMVHDGWTMYRSRILYGETQNDFVACSIA